ncbi:hypothetical protein, partial [Staphylococcus aureus]|uniref:hypothetical protein n=1 Tax=Staphylococcus aureus TaxID=1280 RepID=UPI001E58E41B
MATRARVYLLLTRSVAFLREDDLAWRVAVDFLAFAFLAEADCETRSLDLLEAAWTWGIQVKAASD